MRYIYQDISENEVRLLRVYGSMCEVELPDTIAGKKVTEIGDYCFSSSEHLPADGYKTSGDELGDTLCCISGNYVEAITLPSTITKIGNAAFYNCRKLRVLSIGSIPQLGSDVFVNCFSLCHLFIRGSVHGPSAAQAVLKLISSEVEVTYEKNGVAEAKVLFPEFFETYDEISPAHIFGRNIEGEGFRARTCFRDDVIEPARYDDIFYKARNEESLEVLWHMSYDRLRYPVDLKSEPLELYEEYLDKNIESILAHIMRKKDMEQLQFLCSYERGQPLLTAAKNIAASGNVAVTETIAENVLPQGENPSARILTASHLDKAIQHAAELDWTEAGAYLMEQKHDHIKVKKQERYTF